MNLWHSQREWLVSHGSTLINTHRRFTGRDLIESTGNTVEDSRRLFEAPFVVVSAGTDADQTLNYANETALRLWEMDWDTLVKTPSRHTAEPVHRDERSEFLRRVRESGFIDDYSGIRISSQGNRFRIAKATVWNLTDPAGNHIGQAATFSSWEPLSAKECI